jgi:hypothetical protein
MLLNSVKHYFNGLIWHDFYIMYGHYLLVFSVPTYTPPLPSLPLLKRAKNERI